jgi:5-formyltetrahydrofolate cyclo-ligase
MTEKAALRARYTALRGSLSPEERAAAEAAIYEKLFALPAWRDAPLVCGYCSMGSELNTDPIWKRAAAEGKSYALPVTVTDAREGNMIFRALSDYAPHRLTPARYGIREPDGSCPALTYADLENALILVPALAIDSMGFRLGYGGGYYDRYLEGLRQAGVSVTTVGAVFAVCRADSLPHQPHDIPVDIIIDERRTVLTHG